MWVKMCGIRDVATAADVVAAGADALGLNFYARSSRAVSTAVAREIVQTLPSRVTPIGLFVNSSREEIEQVCHEVGLTTVQLHGDEPPELLAELGKFRVLRAFRVGPEGLSSVWKYLERCADLGQLPWACLIDAHVPGEFGGTGQTAPWELIAAQYRRESDPPLILAGGLTPENVRAAVAIVQPWGVDVAGGVEAQIACKDPVRVRQFVTAARADAETTRSSS